MTVKEWGFDDEMPAGCFDIIKDLRKGLRFCALSRYFKSELGGTTEKSEALAKKIIKIIGDG